MKIIKPEKLKKGDTIGILAPAGNYESDGNNILYAVNHFEKLGYKTVLSENIFDIDRYLAGNDDKRVSELHKFFASDTINAIICLRGGYGSLRIVDKIDYDIIKSNPKIFCGFSDITVLNAMFLKNAGLITYHGPMAASDFMFETLMSYTVNEFIKALSGENLCFKADKVYKSGEARGILWGGNLTSLASLCGRDFIPDTDFIFFTEDINEPVYKTDRMLQQLTKQKNFKKNVKAFVFGDFYNTDNKEWLEILIKEVSETFDVPVIKIKNITHLSKKITLPTGSDAEIKNNCLIINQ